MSNVQLLPEDVIIEILSRLPVKPLSRFKCVSKSWQALISDPRFMIRHFMGTNNHDFLLVSHLRPVKRQVLSFLSCQTLEMQSKCFQLPYASNLHDQNRSYAQILGSCNGVFCLFDGKDGISLWNPATRCHKFLPPSHVEPPEDAFPFDVCVGFGYDARSDDYKVLSYKHMCFPSSATIAHAELYSLKRNKWKEVEVGEEFQPTGNIPSSSCSPSINGVFSWFEIDNHVRKVIFSFNMSNEVFIKTQLPDYDGIPSKRVHGSLASLRNSLAFIHDYPLGGVSKCFDVWVLGEYGVRESWTKQVSVGPIPGVTAPLGIWKNGELLLEDAGGKLMSYDPMNQDLKDLQAHKVNKILQVLPYKESLICLKGAEGGSEDSGQNVVAAAPFCVCECEEKEIV